MNYNSFFNLSNPKMLLLIIIINIRKNLIAIKITFLAA